MSPKLKEELNAQTMEIMNTCLNKVKECLTKEWAIVEDIAQEMLKKEELTYNEVDEIFRKHGKSKAVSINDKKKSLNLNNNEEKDETQD